MNWYVAATAACLVLVALLLLLRWKLRGSKSPASAGLLHCAPVHLVHRLCLHNNVVQHFQVEGKDSLDEHLDALTRKLAEKEGRLHISKYKIRETQDEIQSLHAIDHDLRAKYREIMDSLRNDLMANEKECRKLQEQIEWVSRRRAEIRDEVREGQKLYGSAAVELAGSLAELQRGRVTSKPQQRSSCSLRLRKQPALRSACPDHSATVKSPRVSDESVRAYKTTDS